MIKQVIVVRKDLNMRKGKMCAQVAHASMKVFFDRMKMLYPQDPGPYAISNSAWEKLKAECNFTNKMVEWKEGSFAKIVVGCNSEQELFDLQKQADEAGIVNAIILDNGMTEFSMGCYVCQGEGELRILDHEELDTICPKCHGIGKIPRPTYTCLAIGPDEAEKIDKITGELKLL
jgi:PTH2 family peptidyl-tRNA hydrolase